MPISITLQLLLFSVMLSAGQILFKKVAQTHESLNSIGSILMLWYNGWFWAASILYIVATLFWISILQKIPLSWAYPFVALGFVLVPLASWFLFKESIHFSYVFGVALVIGGLGFIMYGTTSQ